MDKIQDIRRDKALHCWILRAFAGISVLVLWFYLTSVSAAGLADVQALAQTVRGHVIVAEKLVEFSERKDAYEAALQAFDELTRMSTSTEPAEAETVAYARTLLNDLAAGGVTRDMLLYGRVTALVADVPQDRDDLDDTRIAAYLASLEINDASLQASTLLDIADSYQESEASQAIRFVSFALDRLIELSDPHERSVGMSDAIATALRLGPLGFTVAEDTIARLREAPLRTEMRHRRALALIDADVSQATANIRQTLTEQTDQAARIQTLIATAEAALMAGDMDGGLLAAEIIPLDAKQKRRKLFRAIHRVTLEKQRYELGTAAAFGIPGLGEQSDLLLDQVDVHLARHYPDRARAVANLILEGGAASEALTKIGKHLANKGYHSQAEEAFQSALTALDRTEDRERFAKQTGNALKAMAESGFAELAEGELARLLDDSARARPLAALVKHHARAGKLQQAEQLFAHIEAGEHRSYAAGILAKAMADEGRLDAAESYVAFTMDEDDRGRGWYGIARALAHAGDEPEPALAKINAPRWRSDALAQVARVLAKRGERQTAERYFAQALELARTLPDEQPRLMRRIVQARAAINGNAQARALLAELPAGHERFKAIFTLLEADIEAGRFEAAQQLRASLDNSDHQDEATRHIAIGLAEQGETRQALALARGIGHDQQRVKALRRIAEIEADRNDLFKLLPGERDIAANAVNAPESNTAPPGSIVELSAQLELQPLASTTLGRRLPVIPSLAAEVETVRRQMPAVAPGKAHDALMNYSQYSRKFFSNTEQEGGGRRLAKRQGAVSPRHIYLENGVFNLAAISRALQVSSAEDAVQREGDIVTVRLPILIGPDATLIISGNELAELRLSASQGAFIVNAGKLYVVDTRVVGYDEDRQQAAWHTYKERYNFRPFILSWSNSDTQLAGSSFVALGYTSFKAYGISLSSGPTDMVKGSEKAKRPTGIVVENSFDNIHYGFYSYEADYVKLVGNEYRNNIVYGIDPHDRSRHLVIAYNTAYGTQVKHGIIISREVDHTFIIGNVSFDNVGSGFMLDRDCIETLVYANTAFENQQDGMAVFESACNLLAANHVFDNRRAGIKIRNSWDVGVFRNRLSNNQGAALEGYIARLEDGRGDVPRDLVLDPYTPVTTFTAVDNLMHSNDSGIIGKGVTAMTLVSNRFVDQSTKLFGGDLRPHTLDLLPFSRLARSGALVMSTCRPPPPPVECAWRNEQHWFDGDGQDSLFATAEDTPACDQVPGTVQAQALMTDADMQKTQVD